MKFSKGQFKEMLKECIRELIVEGAFDVALEEAADIYKEELKMVEQKHSKEISALKKQVKEASAKRATQLNDQPSSSVDRGNLRRYLEEQLVEGGGPDPLNDHLNNLVNHQARAAAGGDAKKAAMMHEIFADTARSMRDEKMGIVSEGEMNELKFLGAGDTNKWAKILNQSLGTKK